MLIYKFLVEFSRLFELGKAISKIKTLFLAHLTFVNCRDVGGVNQQFNILIPH
jgi:hypothetical protein